MIILAAMCGVLAITAFLSNEFVAGIFLGIICILWMFAGLNDFSASRRKKYSCANSLQNNMFYNHPMLKEILCALDENGCYESISFDKDGILQCRRRKFDDDDIAEFYYDFEYDGEKVYVALEDQCELLKILKHYLPNGDTYQIQAAYDRREYEEFRDAHYGNEILLPPPQYYMMFTEFYDDRRWNSDAHRWERI